MAAHTYTRECDDQGGKRFTRVSVRDPGRLGGVATTAKSLTPEQADNVRTLLREMVQREGWGGQTRVAKRIGVEQQSVSRVIRKNAPESPGVYLASRLAAALGTTFEAVVSGQTTPSPSESRVERPERYPSFHAAEVFFRARHGDEAQEALDDAVQRTRAALKAESDPGADFWLTELEAELRILKREQRDPVGTARREADRDAEAEARLAELRRQSEEEGEAFERGLREARKRSPKK